jgi:putative DNA primase/helicase
MDNTRSQKERGDLSFTPILSGNYTQNFREAMEKAGVPFKETLIGDGTIHRFSTVNKGNKDGWYVFYGLAGAFGDWSRNIHEKWNLQGEGLLPQDKEKLSEQIRRAQEYAKKEKLRKYEETALLALEKWNSFSETGTSPYLEKKKIKPFGVRFRQDYLIIPLKDAAGKLWSLQWIGPEGTKRFLPGGRKKGCFHPIGKLEDGKPLIIVEGYATGASIRMATGWPTVIAFDAGSLGLVIEELKSVYPKSPLLIAGDEDCWKERNIGREKAEEVAHKYGCSLVFPQFKNTETHPTDFNDLHILEGLEAVKYQIGHAPLIVPESQSFPQAESLPIKSTLLPVLPMTLDMLPVPFQPWVRDICNRRRCPLDFVAIPAILMMASLIGARCSIKPNSQDDWTVVPNLWGGILGDPGTLKSPICSEVLFPFWHLELKAKKEYTEKKSQYEAEKTVFLEAKNALEHQIKEAIEKGSEEELASLKDQLATLLKKCPPEPHFKRYKVSDTTLEKMHEILSQNSGGVLIYRDELMGFLESWEKKGHESDRSFYLEAWNGDKPYTIDRMGRGTIHAQNICVSILGTTQPDKITAYLNKALTKLDNDGLLQRFQLLVYPNKTPWKLVDQYPDSFAKNRILHICKTIDAMVFTEHGAKTPEPLYEGQHTIPYFRFSWEAQLFFHDWIKQLQEKLEGNDHPIILQHLSKYRSLMPSLALIFHIIHIADGQKDRDVTLESAKKAAACCDYLESHARRIYGMVLDTTFDLFPKLSKAEELLAWMKKQSNNTNDPLTRRFIMRYSKFRSSKELDPLLSDLIQMGYIQEVSQGCFSPVSLR